MKYITLFCLMLIGCSNDKQLVMNYNIDCYSGGVHILAEESASFIYGSGGISFDNAQGEYVVVQADCTVFEKGGAQ